MYYKDKEGNMNDKWKNKGKTEILDDDFLTALDLEIQKKYPNNTKKYENTINIDDTIEILNDKFEGLSKASKNLEDTIEFLNSDISPLKIQADEEIEILTEEIEEFHKPSENLENTIELLDIQQPDTPIRVKNKIKPKKRPWIILLTVCTLMIIFFGYKAFFWQRDSLKTNKQIEKIIETTKTKESMIKKENIAGATTEEDDRYFNYLDVDFTDLLKTNNEVKGWIKVNNTNINYPFVQTTDNEFYLKHSFDKSYNSAGWVFADFRNNFAKLDQNTILYAHGRLDNTMFGSLKKVVEKNWYENMENEFLQISTLDSNTIWQIFSVYTIEPETYYITPNFDTKEEYQEFLTTLTNRSVHDFQVNLTTNDKVLTLSSCYNDTLRVVLHAKLVNIEKK